MSTDHRKPVVAFAMLVLAAALVIGVQHAEAQGGRLLAAATGVGAHVQGTIVSPSETIGSRGYDRLADLAPAFVSVREAVGHADVSTVTTATGKARGARHGGTSPTGSQPGRGTQTVQGPERAAARTVGTRAGSPALGDRIGAPGKADQASKIAKSGRVGKLAKAGKSGKPAKVGKGATRRDVASSPPARSWSVPGGVAPGHSNASKHNGPVVRPGQGKSGRAATWSNAAAPGHGSLAAKRAKPQRWTTRKNPWSSAAHRSVRPTTRPARVATTPRASAVRHSSARPHKAAHGRR